MFSVTLHCRAACDGTAVRLGGDCFILLRRQPGNGGGVDGQAVSEAGLVRRGRALNAISCAPGPLETGLRSLEIGLRGVLHIREERLSSRDDACRLLYVSDLHLRNGRSAALCRQVLDAVARCRPDALLFGGDLVDHRSELSRLSDLVHSLRGVAAVLAIGGNHDRRLGMDCVRDAVVHGGGQWIHGRTARLTHGARVIAVSGPEAAEVPVDGHVRVLCAHNPRKWKTCRRSGYDLVLAGHLHGCQLVAWEFRDRLFPGAIFYPYCFSSRRCGSTRLVVSRGVSDLVPIRWRCPREVVLCCV